MVRVIGLILLLIGFILFIWLNPTMGERVCKFYEEDKNYGYEGDVVNKYIDSLNHSYPIVVFGPGYKGTERIDYTHDVSGLFEFIQVGDKVIKKKGTYDVVVTRGDKESIFTLDYGCSSD